MNLTDILNKMNKLQAEGNFTPYVDPDAKPTTGKAAEQGYGANAYHYARIDPKRNPDGSLVPVEGRDEMGIEALLPTEETYGGGQLQDVVGVHSGTPPATHDRWAAHFLGEAEDEYAGLPPGSIMDMPPAQLAHANNVVLDAEYPFMKERVTYPLVGQNKKSFVNPDTGQPFTESQMQDLFQMMEKDPRMADLDLAASGEAEREFARRIFAPVEEGGFGYDSVPYINDFEDPGSVSWIHPPENLRSPFAKFDPEKKGEVGLSKLYGDDPLKALINNLKNRSVRTGIEGLANQVQDNKESSTLKDMLRLMELTDFGGQLASGLLPFLGKDTANSITAAGMSVPAGLAELAALLIGSVLPGPQGQGKDWAEGTASAVPYPNDLSQLKGLANKVTTGSPDWLKAAGSGTVNALNYLPNKAVEATGNPTAGEYVNLAPDVALTLLGLGPLRKALPQ